MRFLFHPLPIAFLFVGTVAGLAAWHEASRPRDGVFEQVVTTERMVRDLRGRSVTISNYNRWTFTPAQKTTLSVLQVLDRGDTATVEARLHSEGGWSGVSGLVILRYQRFAGIWRFVEVAPLPQTLSEFERKKDS